MSPPYCESYTVSPPLRRNTPSLPAMSGHFGMVRSESVSSRFSEYETVLDAVSLAGLGELRPGTPQMDTRPLKLRNSKWPPQIASTLPGRRGQQRKPATAVIRSPRPPTPRKRRSSTAATLKRSNTLDGRKSGSFFSQLDGPSDIPDRKKNVAGVRGGMAWLQRPDKKDVKTRVMDIQASLSTAGVVDARKPIRDRSFTDPARPVIESASARGDNDVKRAISSGSRFKKALALGADASIDEEPFEPDDTVDKMKKWKKRVFSKDFFNTKPPKLDKKSTSATPYPPSIKSEGSDKTVVTRKSFDSQKSSDTIASQAASTVEEWQVDGTGAVPYEDGPDTSKVFNDSVIGMIDGKVGGISKPTCRQQWKPPILTLGMQVVSPVDRIPVKTGHDHEFWVAVVLQGRVVGDVDSPGVTGNATGIGLDVGVLLDISSYTSMDSFEEMKREAKRLVESMDTSKDRINVMTFSSPPLGRRKPSSGGRANLRVLNSTGSVAKKQLIEDISTLEPGLQADPAGRDVPAAIAAAMKVLHDMPHDTGRYGTLRSGHLFLITSKLDHGLIQGDFGGVKVHVLGVGPVFNPISTIGGDGWCAAMASPLEQVRGLKKIVADGVEIPVDKPSGVTDVKCIVRLLRMGIDVGTIEGGDLFLYPGEGCKIKGVLGDTRFSKLLPGERRCLMVKIGVGDLPGWDSQDVDIDGVERQIQATLGQLVGTILTTEAVYRHSQLGNSPTTIITTKAHVDVLRYVEGCVWSRSTQELNDDMPAFFTEEKQQSDKALCNAVWVQVLAARHTSARDARHAIEKLKHDVDAPAVLRELGYQVYLEDRFKTRTIAEDSTAETYSDPMMEVFERHFSPEILHGNKMNRDGVYTSRDFDVAGSDLLMDGSPWGDDVDHESLHVHSDSEIFTTSPRRLRPERRQTPDEAKRLWMRLGGGFDEDNVGALNMSDDTFADIDDRDVFYGTDSGVERRNSVGQETMITLRDVRETDFSPWVL